MRKGDLVEDRTLGPAGFIFQTTVRAKKGSQVKGAHRATRIATAMGQIGRIARRRPEVMVKVTGSARGLRSLKEHLAYITRNGKLLGERESGELILGATNVRSVAEEWWADCCRGRNARARDTINLILSMPPGTDAKAVADAASSFAQKTFGQDYEYLLAHHNQDSDPKRPENPHAHLTVKTRGKHGQWLNPRKHDLQTWREVFALELRERGVIAEATRRQARGVVRKSKRQAVLHLDARKGSRVTQWKLQQAIKTVAAGTDQAAEAPWEQAIHERQRKIRRAWNTLAAAFEAAGQAELAQEIKQFVLAMPLAQTEREHFVSLARKLLEKQQVPKQVRHRGQCR
ncbi:MAG: IncQ plasmid conjugative transfer DNA nicking endonuclease TraR [Rhodanobacteraceae bacterium]|nr:MAG: IncQ plasmid conjugative transfer DNA nicking endonuclease TraR [Rhodanobacteraceae bacterium]